MNILVLDVLSRSLRKIWKVGFALLPSLRSN
jgi:hypothetical protein